MQSTDQIGHNIQIQFPPKRIVSLVPSQTEFLFDIGLDAEVIGVTRFCIHPKGKTEGKAKIGGTKKFDVEKIKALNPDLVIGNKEENYEEGIRELSRHFPVWTSDIYTLEDNYAMMHEIGRITGKETDALKLIAEIRNGFSSCENTNPKTNSTCAYFIWRKPYMVAAANTFIDHMLHVAGFKNVFAQQQRYPEINPEILAALTPKFIFLSSEPYSFSERHFEEFQSFAPKAKVVLVDGEMFSWYGSRLRFAPEYFSELHRKIAYSL